MTRSPIAVDSGPHIMEAVLFKVNWIAYVLDAAKERDVTRLAVYLALPLALIVLGMLVA